MKLRAAAVTFAALALFAGSISPAVANNAAAERRMMTQKDVPASFGKPTSFDFDAKVIGKKIGICDNAQGQTLVSVPAPPRQFLVDIETKNKKTYTEVMERVWQFSSPQQAQSAYTQLSSNLATCNGTTTMEQDGPGLSQTVTTGSEPGGANQSFWINVSGTWSGGDLPAPTRTALYAVYVQAGNAIVETIAYINGRAQLTAKQRGDLARLAQRNGTRWAR
jgi:hypothetical protein